MVETLRSNSRFSSQLSAGLVMSIWLLMVFTFSAPEDWKQGTYGTEAILAPQKIKALKLATRLIAGGLILFSVVSLCRSKGSGRLLSKYLPLTLFFIWIVTTIAWSPLKSVSIQQAGSFAISALLAFAISVSYRNEKDASKLFCHVSTVLLLISIGLLGLAIGFPEYGVLTKESSGLFHSTTAGASASLGIILTFGCLCACRWTWAKILIIPAIVIHLPVLLIAANRFSILLGALALVTISLFFLKQNEFALVTIFAALIGLTYLLVDPNLKATDFVVDKVESYALQGQTTSQFKTISGREEMWQRIWDSYLKSPVLGHGYFVTSRTGRINVWGQWGNWTAHNMYLQVLVSTGLIGMLLFIGAMVAPCLRLFRIAKRESLAALLLVLCAWFGLWGVLNSSIVGPTQPESVVFAMVYGLSIAIGKRPIESGHIGSA